MKWNTHAGGTFAAPNKYGYTCFTEFGEYHIWPISHSRNSNRHLGYRVSFANTKGKLTGGLWRDLSNLHVNLNKAKQIAAEHNAKLMEMAVEQAKYLVIN